MKNRFIVLIDLSEYSRWMLLYAYNWAQSAHAELLLVHQTTDPVPGLGETSIISEIKKDNSKRALKALSQFVYSVLPKGTKVKLHVTSHNLENSVQMLRKSQFRDIFFVGMKYKSLFEKIFISSTAIRLADEIENIIVAIPEKNEDAHLDTLYIGIKQKYPLNEEQLEHVLSIAGNAAKKLHFFSMLKEGEPAAETESYVKEVQLRYTGRYAVTYAVYKVEDAFQGIKDFMHANNGTLVIQKGTRSLVDYFRKYYVNDLINYAQIPLIILPVKPPIIPS